MSLARTRRTRPFAALVVAFGAIAGLSHLYAPTPPPADPPAPVVTSPVAAAPRPVPPKKAAKPPAGLKTITYVQVPGGFPADPEPAATAFVAGALHAPRRLALYDAPGGTPRAYLPPSIRGVPVTVPIVARRPGWVAVLLPSVNRRIGWLPDHGWEARTLRDQLVLSRSTHELTWLRDGVRRESWTVATGAARTPTPLGRTFVLGRTGTRGEVYAGLDALVLGAVPDDRGAVAPGLQDAHTGIHAWYRGSVFGRSVSNGCIRLPAAAQRTLLDHIGPGTVVSVVDRAA
ncbi:L,D-transpeptidase [Actinoplanes sp. CA-030573]|uniref:L,D-transpeptidase n=1 Tax=Actinoplanes sp. CA-030573 TaxID=3239898 RepID=UPI003D90AEAD